MVNIFRKIADNPIPLLSFILIVSIIIVGVSKCNQARELAQFPVP
jgi:hypothetical protein